MEIETAFIIQTTQIYPVIKFVKMYNTLDSKMQYTMAGVRVHWYRNDIEQ